MKYLTVIFILFILTVAIIGLKQRNGLQQLKMNNASLETVSEKVIQLKLENKELGILTVDQEELERLREHTEELLRLRNEVSQLRNTEMVDSEQLQLQIKEFELRTERGRERAENIKAWEETNKTSREIERISQTIGHLVHRVAELNNGNFPRSFQEVQMILNNLPESAEVDLIRSNFDPMAERDEFSKLELVTFLITNRTGSKETFTIIREKIPRQLPDGQWIRFYGLGGGGGEEIILPENRFSEWELENFQ